MSEQRKRNKEARSIVFDPSKCSPGLMRKYQKKIRPHLALITSLARSGATNKDIAEVLRMSHSNFGKYLSIFKPLAEATREGKKVADAKVENALYKIAVGYDSLEQSLTTENLNGNQVKKKTTKTTKHHPPQFNAIQFWLANRIPEKWKNSTNVNHSGGLNNTLKTEEGLDITKLTSEELDVLEVLYAKSAPEEISNE